MCVMEGVDVKVSSVSEYAPSIVMAPHDKMPLSSKLLHTRTINGGRASRKAAEGAADERPRGSQALSGRCRLQPTGSRLFMGHKPTSLQAHQLEPEDVYH